jgi:CheY-like chemotaxis protein
LSSIKALPTSGLVRDSAGSPTVRAECILVVDDEPQSREMHAVALGGWGYKSVVAQNGFEALLKVAEHSPDLVISDLRMRGMSGFELLSVLRRRYPEIPLLCISGEYEPLHIPPYVVCDTLLRKGSYQLPELRAKVAELLGQHRAAHLKRPRAVVWLPKGRDDYYTVTCTNCLRSFPVRGTTDQENAEERTPCTHCKTVLTYFIEGSRGIAPAGS